MKITKRTKTKMVLPLLTDERLSYILEKVPEQPLDVPIEQMSVGQFCEAVEIGYATQFFEEKRAFVAFGKLKTYKREVERIMQYINTFNLPQSAEQKKAAAGIKFPSLQKRIILDCVKFYHLHSTEEAERLPLADWLVYLEDSSTDALYQMRYSEIKLKK